MKQLILVKVALVDYTEKKKPNVNSIGCQQVPYGIETLTNGWYHFLLYN